MFAKSAWSGAELELARFTITAEGYDVEFDGNSVDSAAMETDISSACLRFDVIASTQLGAGEGAETSTFYLYDWNETIVASEIITWTTSNNGGNGTSVSFLFEEDDVTVPSGTTKEFHIDLKSSDLVDIIKTDEYIYMQLRNDDGENLATGNATAFWGQGVYDIVWDDGTHEEGIGASDDNWTPERRFGMPALIKNVGPLPITFRTLRGTGTP